MTDVINYINDEATQNGTMLCILSISFLFVSGIITASSGSKGGFRDRRSRVTERWTASPSVKFVIPRAAPSALVQRLERQLGSVSDNSVRNVRLQLARAGYRGRRWLVAFRAAKVCCPMLGVLIGLLVVLCFPEKIVDLYIRYGIMITFLAVGFYMPDLIVGNLGRRRLSAIRKSLP